MDAHALAQHRLHNQRITQHSFHTPAEVVRWLGAIQGQDYPGAKWVIGLRLPDSTDAAIERMIEQHAIVRTWLLRGTLHLVAAEDIRWLLALVAPRVIAGNARRYRELGLDEPAMARSNDILAGALQAGEALDRPALLARLEQHGISTEGQRGVYLLQRASLDGLIAQGVQRAAYATFFALDTLPPSNTPSREEALAALARRYFTSHGPATVQDFVWWSGLTTTDARAALASVQSELVEDTIDGQVYWGPDVSPAPSGDAAALLPGFDEYLLGYRDRRAVLDPAHEQHVKRGGMLAPTVVLGGRVVGTWQHAITKKAVRVTPHPFTDWSDADLDSLASAARRYGEYLELPAAVV